VTIEAILDETRNGFTDDYRAWGAAAAAVVVQDTDLTFDLVRKQCEASARQRLAREARRLKDGLARLVADRETGQMTIWTTWTDVARLRREGRRLITEGSVKAATGRRMLWAADCVEAHPGMTAFDAWVAEGLDPAEMLPADDEAAAA
jgi:hypothetical protein